MFKDIKKMIISRRFALPLLGLAIAIAAVGQRAQPVLSKQIALLQATTSKAVEEKVPTITWMANNSEITSESISKEARLRRALNRSSSQQQSAAISVSPGETYTWMQRNISDNSEDLTDKLKRLSIAKKRTIGNKASIKGRIPKNNYPNSDGVFLYGSSPQPGQFGKGYIVFEKQDAKVLGAMYMISSEFNCFQGTLDKSGEIAMTVKGYAGDVSLNQVASANRLPKINENELTNYPYSLTLKNYYQLDSVDNNDQLILEACKAQFN